MSVPTPDLRPGTVGEITSGEYAGWYVFVHRQHTPDTPTSYVVYQCTDTTFAFEPEKRQCFDQWVEDEAALAALFEQRFGSVTWHPDIVPPIVRPSPRGRALIDRFRARRATTPAAADDADE